MTDSELIIQEKLFVMQDLSYKNFHAKLMPNINPDVIIGVRTPKLRKLSKDIKNEPYTEEFLDKLPHQYYEENNLHGFLIEQIKDFDTCINEINKFLPYVDNWATCDMMRPKCFKKNTDKLLNEIDNWLKSDDTYTVRFGIEMLMVYFLDDKFDIAYPERVVKISSEEYYVNMMIAWYFATALAKQYDMIIKYLEEDRLSVWVHNKTIQKAVESYRVSDEKKIYLKTLKRK